LIPAGRYCKSSKPPEKEYFGGRVNALQKDKNGH